MMSNDDLKDILKELDVPMGTDVEKLKKVYKQEADSKEMKRNYNNDNRFVQLPVGETVIRILPPYSANKVEFYDRFLGHRFGGKSATCLREKKFDPTSGCPICQLAKVFFNANTEPDKALGRIFNAQPKTYYNVIVREYKPDNPENAIKDGINLQVNPLEVKILSVGKKLAEKIDEIFNDPEYGDITHIINGFDFIINKSLVKGNDGKTFYPNYDKSRCKRTSSPLATTKEDIKTILNARYNLRQIIDESKKNKAELIAMLNEHFKDNDEILAVIAGGFKSENKPNMFNPSQKEKSAQAAREANARAEQRASQSAPAPAEQAPTPSTTVAQETANTDELDGFEEELNGKDEIPF